MVHQHFMLIPVLSVAENILLGEEPMGRTFLLDRKKAADAIRELGTSLGWEIDPDRPVGQLSVGWQQRVEILKAIYRKAKVLVLDEPTAVLTPQETREIFDVLRRLRARATRSSSSATSCTRSSRSRTGSRSSGAVGWSGPVSRPRPNEDELAEMMVGREVQLTVHRGESHPPRPVLEVSDLVGPRRPRARGRPDVSFEIRAGRSSASPGWPATAKASCRKR